MSSLYDILAEHVWAKPRELVTDWDEFRHHRLPEMPRVAVGRRCYTDLSHRPSTRYIDADDWPLSWRELVPAFLSRRMAESGRKMAINAWSERKFFDLPAPLYYAGGTYEGDWAYVDIRSAYYSIYRRLGTFNPLVSIREDRVTILNGPISLDGCEMFGEDRIARNSLPGLARAQRHLEVRYGKRVWVDGLNRFSSPSLWGAIALVLNSIALDAIEHFGAIYAYTDGFIVPGARTAAFQEYLGEWGLEGRLKGRDGTVRGRGSYDLGPVAGHLDGDGQPHRTLAEVSPAARASLRARLTR